MGTLKAPFRLKDLLSRVCLPSRPLKRSEGTESPPSVFEICVNGVWVGGMNQTVSPARSRLADRVWSTCVRACIGLRCLVLTFVSPESPRNIRSWLIADLGGGERYY